ncbi:MAG: hypothetical protein HPPSJP_0980 [Candidatus Hepatoplasma scabrum]|nr:MAG: hypothetical protein HPPSJP_0980 [Candidatus Hepatoplasma sp.]
MNKDKIIEFAKYIVREYQIESPIKLQKILFLIRYEEKKNNFEKSIFDENFNFEAWINGPVHVNSYSYFRPYFYNDDELEPFLPSKESKEEFKIYDKYIEKYISFNQWKLVDITHANKAWIEARKNLDEDEISKKKIDEKYIEEWDKGKLETKEIEKLILG